MSEAKYVSVPLRQEDYEELQRTADEQGRSIAETVRRAIATDRFFRDSEKTGSKILLLKPDRRYERVILR